MKAAVLRGAAIAIEELPDPRPAAGQVLLAPLATGICGSDLHAVEGHRTAAAAGAELPAIVMGHEFCAEVIALGPDTSSRFVAGARVTAIPFAATDDGPKTVGLSPEYPGGFATLTVVEESSLIAVPDAVPAAHAALTEPLAVGLHAVNLTDDGNEAPSIVLGCGPIGLAVILALRAQGRGPIVAADLSAARRAAAKGLGADVVVDPADASPYERLEGFGFIEETISPLLGAGAGRAGGVTVFECVGAPGLIAQVMSGAPRHSRVVVVGVCPGVDQITPLTGITKELSVQFSLAYRPEEFAVALELIAAHPELVETLITSRLPLTEVRGAFEELASQTEQIKVLIEPQR
jgi:threonine dehydrogenase-like Zn-dependent dehydrogenase